VCDLTIARRTYDTDLIIGGHTHTFLNEPVIVKNKNKSGNTLVRLTIHEGKNRQVRRMFEALGYEVMKLKRESIEDLTLDGLRKGEYRILTIHEVKRLINKAKNGDK